MSALLRYIYLDQVGERFVEEVFQQARRDTANRFKNMVRHLTGEESTAKTIPKEIIFHRHG